MISVDVWSGSEVIESAGWGRRCPCDDRAMVMDAVDGGTTATVIALLDGSLLVHAQVGDSSALLGGTS